MRALLFGLSFMLSAICGPAWAGGFCNGGGVNGSGECQQSHASYQWNANGPILADYSDLGSDVFLGAPTPIHFSLVFNQLTSKLTQEGAKVVVLELTISRVNMQDSLRVLALGVGISGGATVLYADWLQAPPYWSTANETASLTEMLGNAEYALAPDAMVSNISIVPIDGWKVVDLRVDGLSIATFAMPNRAVSGYLPLRLRSGVISATEWHPGMAVEFNYVFPISS